MCLFLGELQTNVNPSYEYIYICSCPLLKNVGPQV